MIGIEESSFTLIGRAAIALIVAAASISGQVRPHTPELTSMEDGTAICVTEDQTLIVGMLPFASTTTITGGAAGVSTSDFVIVGHNGTQGRIEHWHVDFANGTLALVEAASPIPGCHDITAAAYDDQSGRLYVSYSTGTPSQQKIAFTAWVPGQTLAATVWLPFADQQDWPKLAPPMEIFVVDHPFDPSRKALIAQYPAGITLGVFFLEDTPGTITVVPFPFVVPQITRLGFARDAIREGATQVELEGSAANLPFEIRAVGSSTVIATGIMPMAVSHEVPLQSPLEIGETYQLCLISSGNVVDEAVAIRVYGESVPSSSGRFEFSPLGIPHAVKRNAVAYLSASLRDHTPTGSTRVISADGLVGLGFRQGALDPVLFQGGVYAMDPAQAVLVSITGVVDDDGYGQLATSIAIPDDPTVVGLIAFFQFAYAEGGEVALSEILGIEILP